VIHRRAGLVAAAGLLLAGCTFGGVDCALRPVAEGDRPSAASLVSTAAASCAPTVSVAGVQYLVGVGRALAISQETLEPHGEVEAANFAVSDRAVFRLPGVDPRALLVMHGDPAERDDLGSLGEYRLLWGEGRLDDAFPAACVYFDSSHIQYPDECR
jgi:hypothetical protein